MRGGQGDDHLSGVVYVTLGDSIVYGGPGNDVIETGKPGTVIGGAGDDHIRILADTTIVHPGAGDDIIEGDAVVSYRHAPGPVQVDLKTGVATGWGTDRLSGVADVYGTPYDDVMRGAPPFGEFRGFGGDDILEAAPTNSDHGSELDGGRGDDVLRGSGGDDFLNGGQGGDILLGFAGNDTLTGGAGRDELDGGEGRDTISFHDLDGPMVINLSTQKTSGRGADVVVNIEGAKGSRGNDDITGTPNDDHLDGYLGNDTIRGRRGNDTIQAWSGNDVIHAGLGDDNIHGWGGDDIIYAGSGDDHVLGHAGADIMLGGSGNDAIFGGPGDDELLGGAGSNTLDGGADFDTCTSGATYISCELIL